MKANLLALAFALNILSFGGANAGVEGQDASVVFQGQRDFCYRIPSLVWTGKEFVAVSENRSGFNGRRPCSDDGNVDLVMRTSPDGKKWSPISVVLDNDALSTAMSDPESSVYDPDYAKVPKADRYMRVGSQTVGYVKDKLIVVFSARFNLKADCGDKFGCANSPSNLKTASARERYFQTTSNDLGTTWSKPSRIHSEIYHSCIDKAFKDERVLKDALYPLFADDKTISSSTAANRDSIAADFTSTRKQQRSRERNSTENYESIAQKIGIDQNIIKENYRKISMLFNVRPRPGPGNNTEFEYRGKTRIFAPGAPLSFYSDDLGETWVCSDTFDVRKGSERQVASLGDGRLVMSLRSLGGKKALSLQYRLFSVSDDGGESWGPDDFIAFKGRKLLPDAIVQGSIVGISGAPPHEAVSASVAGPSRADSQNSDGPGERERTKRSTTERSNLVLTKIFMRDNKITAGFRKGCDGADPVEPSLNIWSGSAGYSALAHIPQRRSVGVLFEGSEIIKRKGWKEAIRFMEIPLDRLEGQATEPVCR